MALKTRLRLLTADLHYPQDLHVHTAVSGDVAALVEYYLLIERSDGFRGLGAVRANITYLSKLPESAVAPAIIDLCRRLPWSQTPDEVLDSLATTTSDAPPIARAAVEGALIEGKAQAQGVPVANVLGGAWQAAVKTNHCLFWGPDERFDRLAERYVGEGFRDIKVRIGIGSFEHDISRLERLRASYGTGISIAVDVNGVWEADEAIEKLGELARLELSYVEQPTSPGDWGSFEKALRHAPVPLVLDEGLIGRDDVERLANLGPGAGAHLKIVKMGGPLAVMNAARRLSQAGSTVMIGQMNEGAVATAMAAHCVMAAQPPHAELYGCYGLLDDPAEGLVYANGEVSVRKTPGLGVVLDEALCRQIWDEVRD